jgi:hypothetical protein
MKPGHEFPQDPGPKNDEPDPDFLDWLEELL